MLEMFFLGLQCTKYDENNWMNVNFSKKGHNSPKKDNMCILHYSDTQCTALHRLFTSDGSQNEKMLENR